MSIPRKRPRISAGVALALKFAHFYSAIAVLIYLVVGAAGGASASVPLVAVIASYYVSAVVAGVTLSRLWFISRNLAGRFVLGLLLSLSIFTPMLVSLFGPPWRWEPGVFGGLVFLLPTFTFGFAIIGKRYVAD